MTVYEAFKNTEIAEMQEEREYQEKLIKQDQEFQMKMLNLKIEALDRLSAAIYHLGESIAK